MNKIIFLIISCLISLGVNAKQYNYCFAPDGHKYTFLGNKANISLDKNDDYIIDINGHKTKLQWDRHYVILDTKTMKNVYLDFFGIENKDKNAPKNVWGQIIEKPCLGDLFNPKKAKKFSKVPKLSPMDNNYFLGKNIPREYKQKLKYYTKDEDDTFYHPYDLINVNGKIYRFEFFHYTYSPAESWEKYDDKLVYLN